MKKSVKKYLAIGLTVGTLTIGSAGAVYAASWNGNHVNKLSNTSQEVQPAEETFKGRPSRGLGIYVKFDCGYLVEKGIISQETADKITEFMQKKQAEHEPEMEKLKDMTAEEKQAYFEALKGKEATDTFAEMVTEEIITQAEADAIKSAMPAGRGPDMFFGDRGMLDVNALVENGTITQETADKIAAYLENQKTERQTEIKDTKDAAEEKDIRREMHMKRSMTDILEKMVEDGVITQSEANAIKAAMPQPPVKPEASVNASV